MYVDMFRSNGLSMTGTPDIVGVIGHNIKASA